MRIAVDAMGGDSAPREIVRGAIDYALQSTDEVSLVGDVPRLEREVAAYGKGVPPNICYVDAPDVVGAAQLMTVLALDERRRADGEMRAALTLASLGYLSLGDAHAETP